MHANKSRFLIASLLLSIAAALLFVPGLPGEFLFDDHPNIINNPAVHLSRMSAEGLAGVLAAPQPSGPMRALPTLSFAIDYWRAGGTDPMAFKTTNLVIHALTALALAWFLRSLLLAAGVRDATVRWAAPALALAWAAHPLQVSSVLYTVQRIQTMGTLFLVLALWAYLHGRHAQAQGRSGRLGLLGSVLLWIAAMGCKEDSVLLPAYTLALELTVLRFASADAEQSRRLRRGYAVAAAAVVAAYVFVFLPRYWQWEPYVGRDFSPLERMLSQPRMLCMYLLQILAPLPRYMPFYYDWLQPSRGLLQPWTTLPAIATVVALLGTAWRLRVSMPLFAFGVFVFLSAHVIASNALDLELAFEHRNHFAMIGVLLAAASVLAHATGRLRIPPGAAMAACVIAIAALAGATLLRAHAWRSAADIATAGTKAAPASGRAWVQLCASQFQAGGGAIAGNTHLDEAIATCTQGAAQAPQSLNSLTLLVVLKALHGDLATGDWDRLQERLRSVPMVRDNARVFTILIAHRRLGVDLDKTELLETLDLIRERAYLGPVNLSHVGYFVLEDLSEPDRAMPYFLKAVERAAVGDPVGWQLAAQLRSRDRVDLAETLEMAAARRQSMAQ